ncbi:Peroxyureidoacrylate/ureidoacrylate amidohydrolase [Lachnellula occidentalis]|uniref:Peroxyureidoacrylate/ureidoacrylate amidohydrolase n=1 Tax=Lachnellula occidentalis TaxID=215460 RepID=A0A8H8RB85_9HELO|nr:Peroxyureidoacrylate/ureidoacrylate amidohydrolase [Lachnellula occidentalis]
MSSPAHTAIVLIDPYNDFLHPSGQLHPLLAASLAAKNTLAHLQTLVSTARAQSLPIYYGLHQQTHPGFLAGWKHASPLQESQKASVAFEEGSWGVEVFGGLEPDVGGGDVVVSKHWSSSSFQNTDLDYQLRQRDITNLVFGGLTANTCLESTARYAYELKFGWGNKSLPVFESRGYHVTMLSDCTAGFTKKATDAATELIWPLFAHEVMTVEEWKKSIA